MLKGTVGRAPSFGKSLMKGLFWAVGWTLLASMGAAWLLSREFLRMEKIGYVSMGILLVCGLLLAKKGAPGTGRERIVNASIGTSLYFGGLLAVNWLFFGGKFEGFGVALLVLLAGMVLGIMEPGRGRGGVTPGRYKIPKQ